MKDRYIRLAIQQAAQSSMDVRVGAVLVKQKHVMGTGYNRKDDPYLRTGMVKKLHPNFGMHAEVAALANVSETYNADLYVVRLRKDNSIGLAKPCESCYHYLSMMDVKNVIFSDNEGHYHRMRVH
jgi:tRNA(Arg) A34 adenosine deaminase TadA